MSKHILIVSQYFFPESFRINDIAMEWVKRGYKVTVLTGIPNYPRGRFYNGYGWFKKRREDWNGVKIIRIPLVARGKSALGLVLNYLSFVISGFFWKCFTRLEADVVFTFEVSPMTQALIGVWYAKRKGISHYLYVQDLWPENVEIVTGIQSKAIINPISKMVSYIYKNSTKIFATSLSFVEEIRKRLDVNKEKVIYWPQYAEDIYKPSKFKTELIELDGSFNITFTGNIGTAQGLDILPKVAMLLKERNEKVRFYIVGDGRYRESLKEQIKECGVEEYFRILGWQPAESIPSILAASDIAFLSFSNNDLFAKTIPAKMQSYMACGAPVLASAKGETERIIRDAQCGFCSEIGNAVALANTIVEIKELDLKVVGQRGKEYCDKNFNKSSLLMEMDEYLCV